MGYRLPLLLLLLGLAGCGGSSSPTSPTNPNPPPITGPAINCPADVAAGTSGANTAITYTTPSTTGGQSPVTVSCTPASGSMFPLGATTVSCTATDAGSRTASCSFSVTVARIPVLQRTTFLAFGDSLTAGEVTTPTATAFDADGFPSFKLIVVPASSYPTQLQMQLRTRYVTQQATIAVINAGVAGERSAVGAQRFPSVMSALRPEVVLLIEGANDLALFGASGISQAASSVETMAKEARNRGARVFVGSLTPSRPGGRNSLPADQITNLNGRLRSVAAGENATFVDLYQALVGNLTLYIGTDGLHPTEAGYQRIAETFFDAIRATLQAP